MIVRKVYTQGNSAVVALPKGWAQAGEKVKIVSMTDKEITIRKE